MATHKERIDADIILQAQAKASHAAVAAEIYEAANHMVVDHTVSPMILHASDGNGGYTSVPVGNVLDAIVEPVVADPNGTATQAM